MKTTINSWTIRPGSNNPYDSPEIAGIRITGIVKNHLTRPDGDYIATSPVASATGRVVTTRSGSIYHLGTISPTYRAYLRETRPQWDWRNPITMPGDSK